MDSDTFIVLVVTNPNCSACMNMKNTGKRLRPGIDPSVPGLSSMGTMYGGWGWSPRTFQEILFGKGEKPRCRLMEVSISGNRIDKICEFIMRDGKLVSFICKDSMDGMEIQKYVGEKLAEVKTKNHSLAHLLARRFPMSIMKYISFFPLWCVIDMNSWKMGCKGQKVDKSSFPHRVIPNGEWKGNHPKLVNGSVALIGDRYMSIADKPHNNIVMELENYDMDVDESLSLSYLLEESC